MFSLTTATSTTVPTPSFDDVHAEGAYADLAEAVLRGALDCDVLDEGSLSTPASKTASLPVRETQESYRVQFASWEM